MSDVIESRSDVTSRAVVNGDIGASENPPETQSPAALRLGSQWAHWFIEPDPASSNLLTASTGLLAIATVYLYFIGFIYSYFFFQQFGIHLESLDLSTTYYLVHSYSVLNTIAGAAFFAFFVSSIYLAVVLRMRLWFTLVILLLPFPVFFRVSFMDAVKNADQTRKHPETPVSFSLKAPPGGTSDNNQFVQTSDGGRHTIEQLGESGKLWLLFETKDKVIIFFQPTSAKISDAILPADVFTVSISDTRWLNFSIQ